MYSLTDGFSPDRVLALGAHSDDIEIGCGGTILRISALNPATRIDWVVLTAEGERRVEADESVRRFLPKGNLNDLRIESFRERYFPHLPELKEYFDELAVSLDPQVVFCPWSADAHQDHRTIAELARSTFRRQLILEYEIPKIDGDVGRPMVYVDLPSELAERKIELLMTGFASQIHKDWFDREVFRGMLRLRGMESGSPSGYAEAFHCHKLTLVSH